MSEPAGEMRARTYFVAASLLDGPPHGYAIIQRAAQLSGGRVRLATGTFGAQPQFPWRMAVFLAGAALVAAAAIWRLHRQAVI